MDQHLRSSPTSSVSSASDSQSTSTSSSPSHRQEFQSFSMDPEESPVEMQSDEETSEEPQTSSSSHPPDSDDHGEHADDEEEEAETSEPDPNINLVIDSYKIISKIQATTTYQCQHMLTRELFVCSIIPMEQYFNFEAKYERIRTHPGINQVRDVFTHLDKNLIIYRQTFGNFHEFCRNRIRLPENEAAYFFHQMVLIVHDCHNVGLIIRDLKLRRFVFKDEQRRKLVLEAWDESVLLSDPSNDCLSDKYGCPTYASPELVTQSVTCYSGKKADVWSLGIILFAMLTGRYPFYHRIPSQLLHRIERGFYIMPDYMSRPASKLVQGLLNKNPESRLSTTEILSSEWFSVFNLANVTTLRSEPRGAGHGLTFPQILNHPLHHQHPFNLSSPSSSSSSSGHRPQQCPSHCDIPAHRHAPRSRPSLQLHPSTSRGAHSSITPLAGQLTSTDQIVPEILSSPSDDDSPLKSA